MSCLPIGSPVKRHSVRRRFPASLLALLLALMSACSADSEDSVVKRASAASEDYVTESAYDDEIPETQSEEASAAADYDSSGGATSDYGAESDAATVSASLAMTSVTPADLGRDVIYRAAVTVEAPDVAAASREAVAIVQGLGGIVYGQKTTTEPWPNTEMTFKVLPADFDGVLERLAGVGELVEQWISADDVTERIVDFESRLLTAEASVARLRMLFDEAFDIAYITEIERELMDRETTMETLRAQLRTLRDQVDLATITLTINQSPETLPDTGILVRAWASTGLNDPCRGNKEITVETGAIVRFCIEVENQGETVLTDVTIQPETLRLRWISLQPGRGNFDRIEPGQFLVAEMEEGPVVEGRLAGRVATRGLDIQIKATATPVDSDGVELADISGDSHLFVIVNEDDSQPGFTESVGTGVSALAAGVGVVLRVVGVLVPFLPFAVVIGAAIWWLRRRAGRRRQPLGGAETTPSEPTGSQPTGSQPTGE